MRISVVMACYNSLHYISQQIESILPQLDSGDELIIIDDCSNDGTYDYVLSNYLSNPIISIYKNDTNIGVNKTFEKALSYTKGDFIVISDDDDIWDLHKIIKTIQLLENDTLMVVHDCKIVDENLDIICESYFQLRDTRNGLWHNILKPGYRGATMCFKKDLLKRILPFPKNLKMFYDEWISLMAEKYGNVLLINDKLSIWRRRKESVSQITINGRRGGNTAIRLFIRRILHRCYKILLIILR